MAEYKLWQLTADMAGDYAADNNGYALLPREPDEVLCVPWLRHGPSASDPYAWIVEDFDGNGHIAAIPPAATLVGGGAILSVTYIQPTWREASAWTPYGWLGNMPVWECDLAVRLGATWRTGRYGIIEIGRAHV